MISMINKYLSVNNLFKCNQHNNVIIGLQLHFNEIKYIFILAVIKKVINVFFFFVTSDYI